MYFVYGKLCVCVCVCVGGWNAAPNYLWFGGGGRGGMSSLNYSCSSQ